MELTVLLDGQEKHMFSNAKNVEILKLKKFKTMNKKFIQGHIKAMRHLFVTKKIGEDFLKQYTITLLQHQIDAWEKYEKQDIENPLDSEHFIYMKNYNEAIQELITKNKTLIKSLKEEI